MLTQSAILERDGWTRLLLKRLLGEPDELKKVSGYRHPLKLYSPDRVESTEASEAFKAAQAKIAKRKASAQKAVETKTRNLLALVETMPVHVERIPDLTARAIRHYNDRQMMSDGWSPPATVASDQAFLDRISVNYARHCLTRYDDHLEQLETKTGINTAISVIRARVYAAIAEAYPDLSSECQRQAAEKEAHHV